MLKPMCRMLACRNIAVKIVSAGSGGLGGGQHDAVRDVVRDRREEVDEPVDVVGAQFLDEDVDVERDQQVDDEGEDRQPPVIAERDQNCSWRPNTVRRPLCRMSRSPPKSCRPRATLTLP